MKPLIPMQIDKTSVIPEFTVALFGVGVGHVFFSIKAN